MGCIQSHKYGKYVLANTSFNNGGDSWKEEAGGVHGLRGTGGSDGTMTQSTDLWNNTSGYNLFDGGVIYEWHGATHNICQRNRVCINAISNCENNNTL